MKTRFFVFAMVLASFCLVTPSYGWIGPDLIAEDSASIDTFYVSGDADIDTSETLQFKRANKADVYFSLCSDSDSNEVVVMLDQRLWPSALSDSAYAWNVVDSIVITGTAAVVCSLWVPTLKVPPYEIRLRVHGRANNKVGTGGGTSGTAVMIAYLLRELY